MGNGLMNKNSRIRAQALLSALLLSNSLAASQADEKAQERIKKAEEQFQGMLLRFGENSKSTAYQMLNLSGEYQRWGERAKAEETFAKAMRIFEKDGNKELLANAYQNRALMLSARPYNSAGRSHNGVVELNPKQETERKEDIAKAEALYKKALALLEPLPIYNKEKLQLYKSYSNFLRGQERRFDADNFDASLESSLIAAAKSDSVPADNAELVAGELRVYANKYAPYSRRYRAQASESAIKKAEELRLLCIKLYEKGVDASPYEHVRGGIRPRRTDPSASRESAVSVRRELILWYEQLNMIPQAEAQMKILSKEMGTSDPKLLFPPPPPCYGCGMG